MSRSRNSAENITKLPESPTRDDGSARNDDGGGDKPATLASDLDALAALHAKGALTPEEFATAKAKLIASYQSAASP